MPDQIKNINNIKIIIPSKDELIIEKEIFEYGLYSKKGFEIQQEDIIIDIGAHMGYFSVYAAQIANKGKVYAFEPHPKNYNYLIENIKINNFKNIFADNRAVFDQEGVAQMSSTGLSYSYNLFTTNNDSFEVNKISLKNIFDEYKIEKCNYLKIDAEGSEMKILCNLPSKYYNKIDKIAFEYHEDLDQSKKIKQLIITLLANNFKICKISECSRGYYMIYAKKNKKKYIIPIKINYFIFKNKKNIAGVIYEILYNTDKLMGEIGIILKKYFPGLYIILKNTNSH